MKLRAMTLIFALFLSCSIAAEEIPFKGNAFATQGSVESGSRGFVLQTGSVLSLFFHADRPGKLELALKASNPKGNSTISASAGGRKLNAALSKETTGLVALGGLPVNAGYVRLDFEGVSKTGETFGELESLVIESNTPGLVLSHVKNNEGDRFYWGRRGPSVNLGYTPPEGTSIEWFYNEVTVPLGKDPQGSFFMANGFSEGYFGMQVNSATERKILFSVWSPYQTDDPKSIPENQRVKLIAKGEGVKTGEFGNEGSGGQSFLNFPWQAGRTYRFLNRARPDGHGSTIYTAWFNAPENNRWQLIASFKRPKTNTHLMGLHSFLENFLDTNGWLTREGRYGNQWACDTTGQWHPLRTAQLGGDDTAERRYRLDFSGGVTGSSFFLRNGGFFSDTTPLGSKFQIPGKASTPPRIDFAGLEGAH
jgi:hypothetical protein